MDIQKRFDRILAIYFHLQAKPIVKAQDLADRFGVSLRTIYRDIKSLEGAGIPLYGEAGTGYSLMNGYKIQPTLFTKDEALSFAVAEKLMQHYMDAGMSKHFSDALFKMKAILRTTDKENVAQIENQVLIKKDKGFLNENVPFALAILFESIAKQQQILLHYKSATSETIASRKIEVIGVFQENEFWYFMAYCYQREDIRQFRLDRIHQIDLLDNSFSQKLKPLNHYLEKKNPQENLQTVRIRVTKDLARYMVWDRIHFGYIDEIILENDVEMHFKTRDMKHGIARWLMMFADEIEVLEPEDLTFRMQELAIGFLSKFDE